MVLKYKQTILDLNNNELENFLLSNESYFSLQLPSYFDFGSMLKEYLKVYNENIGYIEKKVLKAKKFENVNHIIFANIDNRINWRKFQIINPILYIFFIKTISKVEYYQELKDFFKKLNNDISDNIQSFSLQKLPEYNKKLAGTQIGEWYEKIEKRSIQLALDYKYLLIADIADFYNSIYTHSIPWVLYGKDEAKINKNKDNLGNKIDNILQSLNYGQTNGIPTGNLISDLISEIILRKIDLLLIQKLECKNIKYKILRYRDDYRIFANSQEDCENILKILCEILLEYGLSLNSQKTILCSDIILNSIKFDKIEGINSIFYYLLDYKNYLKENKNIYFYYAILSLYNFSKKFPNSGTLQKLLYKNYEFFSKNKNKNILNKIKEKYEIISILTEIFYNNPKVCPQAISLISLLINFFDNDNKINIIEKIKNKIDNIPNNGYLELWLQRLSLLINKNIEYNEILCKKVQLNNSEKLFNFDFIENKELELKLNNIESYCINNEKIKNLKIPLKKGEISIFDFY